MKKSAILFVFLSIFFFFLSNALADVKHVSTTGTNSSTCGAKSDPCKDLYVAIENAGAGSHVIKVATGNYFQSTSIPLISSEVTIQGGWDDTFTRHICDPAETAFFAIASGPTSVFVINRHAGGNLDLSLECIRITRIRTQSGAGVTLVAQDSGSTINFALRHCIVDSQTSPGISVEASLSAVVTVTVEDSRIYNNRYLTGTPLPSGGMSVRVVTGASVEIELNRNQFTNNINSTKGGGISFYASGTGSQLQVILTNNSITDNQGDHGGGFSVQSTEDPTQVTVTLTNNTVYNNSAQNGGGLYIYANAGPKPVTLRNNIIWGNSASLPDGGDDIYLLEENYWPGNPSGLDVDYSIVGDIFQVNPFDYVDGGHNLSTDPKLFSSHRLHSGSPAINRGQCGTNFVVYQRVAPYDDIEGDPRPGFGQLTGCDIGADEFVFAWPLFLPAIIPHDSN